MIKVEALALMELRKRHSEKWRAYTPDVLPMFVAEMDFEVAAPIRAKLMELAQDSDMGYLGSMPELAQNLATFSRSRWSWEIDPSNVFITSDVGVAMVEMARTCITSGDSIVINSPVYHNFYNWIPELKCNFLDVPLLNNELHYTLDFNGIERAYRQGAKLHFLCNPHNPIGTVFSRSELSQLAELAYKYDVAIFSDEVHAPLVYDEIPFTPFLSVSDVAREVGICTTAASKTWNLAGMKCATIVVASEKWKLKAQSMPEAVHYRASLFGAVAAACAYECVEWLDTLLVTLDHNRKFLKNLLEEKLPSIKYRIPNSTYLAWLDLTALNLGTDPTGKILDNAKVAFSPGQAFAPYARQFTRLNFATSPEIISEAIDRIVKMVNYK
jgi:cystathionine beta-lyase